MGPLVSDYIQQAWDRRAAVKGVSESVVEGGGWEMKCLLCVRAQATAGAMQHGRVVRLQARRVEEERGSARVGAAQARTWRGRGSVGLGYVCRR